VLTSADLAASSALLIEREVAIRALASDVIAVTPKTIAATILLTARGANLPWLGA
jgi:hypothetical protein